MSRTNAVFNTYLPAKTEGVTSLIISQRGLGDMKFYFDAEFRKPVEREQWYIGHKFDARINDRIFYPYTRVKDPTNLTEIFPWGFKIGGTCMLMRFVVQCAFPRGEINVVRQQGIVAFDDFRLATLILSFKGKARVLESVSKHKRSFKSPPPPAILGLVQPLSHTFAEDEETEEMERADANKPSDL